jgi:hypothetical protein
MRTDLTDDEMRYVEHVRIYMMGMERILDTSIPMAERTRLRERKKIQYGLLLAKFRILFPRASIRLADYYQSPDIRPPSPPFDLPDVSNDVFDELALEAPAAPTLQRTDSGSDYGTPWYFRYGFHPNAPPGWMPSLPTIEYIEEEPDFFQEPMARAAAAGSRPVVFQEPMARAAASRPAASVPGESLWQTYYRLFPQPTVVRPQKRPTSKKSSQNKSTPNKRHPSKKGTKSRKLRKLRKSHTK